MAKKKYETEEERKAAHREAQKRYKEANPEKVTETQRRYRKENPEKIKEMHKLWRLNNSDKIRENNNRWKEKNPDKVKEYNKRYKEKHPEKCREYSKQYYQEHPEKERERNKRYRKKHPEKSRERIKRYRINNPEKARASHLVGHYKLLDKKHNRGECTLTAKWVVENIFSKPCHYCGKEGWDVIGCDRIDNSKPHTPDNVVPCCYECNTKKGLKDYNAYIEKMLAEQSC